MSVCFKNSYSYNSYRFMGITQKLKVLWICPYTAECLALSEALYIALRNPLNNYKILADSLSVIQSLNSNKSSIRINPYIPEVKDKFCKYINQKNNYGIEFIWIPAHIGIYGNEEVDKLAKTATINQPEPVLFIPFSDYKQLYKGKAALNTRKLNEQ